MSRKFRFDMGAEADLPITAFRKIGNRMTLEFGGGGSAPSTSTTYTSNLPSYAEPYFTDIMGRSQQASMMPYAQYTGDRAAGFSPNQLAAQGNIAGLNAMGTPQGLTAGQNISGTVANNLAQYQYDPNRFTSTNVTAGQLGPQLDASSASQIQGFMNPYQQRVTDINKAAAARDYQIASQARNTQGVRAGAFGGARQGIQESEAQRTLMAQLQNIQDTGSKSAFENAQQSLQAQRAAQMQAGTTNIQTQQQADLANAQAAMQAQQAGESSRQFGASSGLQAQQQLAAAGQAQASMGEAEQSLALARINAQSAVGVQEQALAQSKLDQAYALFAQARDYEQNMINWQNSILRGTPVSMDQSVYQAAPAPSLASQLVGSGIGIAGLMGAKN